MHGSSIGTRITHQNLVQEVLNELLLQWPRSQKTVQVGTQKLGNEVTEREISISVGFELSQGNAAYMSSKGEMKMSLKEIICRVKRDQVSRPQRMYFESLSDESMRDNENLPTRAGVFSRILHR